MSFDSLGLSADILRAIDEQGYRDPTPVQRQAIPVVLEGRDLMASAQTGTGKTAGFTLPLLQLLNSREAQNKGKGRRPVRALILTPTRELAAQIDENVKAYSKYLRLRSLVVFGGVSINPQMMKLRGGVDILVATPGRLLDLEHQNAVDLSQIEILVLDEADRMLDMGFIHDIRRVLAKLPAKRQNLLFSATFSDEIKALANKLLTNPASVEVVRRNTPSELVTQHVHFVDKRRKRELLSQLIGENNWQQVLVFTRTKHGANHLAELLEKDGITAAAIHGNKSQGARTRALANFKDGSIRVLVATDIAARGLDIDQLPHVVNYELPNVPEDYVHRIGRTGRAEATGEALSLVCVDEHKLLRDIERLLKREIPRIAIEGYEPDPSIKAEPIVNGRQGNRGGGGARNGSPRAQSGAPRGQSERSQGQSERRSADGNRQPRKSGGNSDSPWGGNKGNGGKGNGEGQRRAPRPQNRSKPADK
ncbi:MULTISPECIES: ATP-dependent RNA helicase RhlE [Pectobacterium]|jgi:ATP-dependent RNA helicase RhlE|uniref:ATP-dependent RNA helicase RhlE n=2 Tax=Pectobacterium TaxID=122277 RepID=A0AAW3SN79_9GAMM|nr:MULTISPECIES: ATP-dependent RNA helicase RhlE [Pectobacterium]ACT12571.1 DEAD/DEAH box helicase domain protein [Pectobacterium carotovorum subsp. carotovorum PC1]MBA5202504.1 ATP-dependent RNA helicase RhlE [Pectobacterium aroidearum]MBA5236854.1 ATP-dependent RNA helicase RhlE [Pectobacterium aroidearum]MBA5600083.1 ATP-dependent RNA helicase RhlE [Pectobacterium aroidearum]QPI44618.1 ATP-dependent RNA helicase RhlE [Pectobacterium aroidearum]